MCNSPYLPYPLFVFDRPMHLFFIRFMARFFASCHLDVSYARSVVAAHTYINLTAISVPLFALFNLFLFVVFFRLFTQLSNAFYNEIF